MGSQSKSTPADSAIVEHAEFEKQSFQQLLLAVGREEVVYRRHTDASRWDRKA